MKYNFSHAEFKKMQTIFGSENISWTRQGNIRINASAIDDKRDNTVDYYFHRADGKIYIRRKISEKYLNCQCADHLYVIHRCPRYNDYRAFTNINDAIVYFMIYGHKVK